MTGKTERCTPSGEQLQPGEYQLKNGRYKCSFKDNEGKNRTVNAISLEELRSARKDVEEGKPRKTEEAIRYSPEGEILHTNEFVRTENGKSRYYFMYFVESHNGKNKRTVSSNTLTGLRVKEDYINNGQFEKLRERVYTGKDKKKVQLRTYEYIRTDGSYAYDERSTEGRIIVYASTIKELRRRVRNIKSGHPELNDIHTSKKGETLYKGESCQSDGRYYYSYNDESGNYCAVSASTLDLLRVKEEHIRSGHRERCYERYSKNGELLNKNEYEHKQFGGFWGYAWNPVKEKKVHFYGLTLEILRERRGRIEQGLDPIVPIIRYTTTGEILNMYEHELPNGKFNYAYSNRNGQIYVSATTIEELRWKVGNIENGHSDWNRPNYTREGERLFKNEDQLLDGKVTYEIADGCYIVAPNPEALRDIKSKYYRGFEITRTEPGHYTVYEYVNMIFKEKKDELKFTTYARNKETVDRYLRDSSLGNTYLNDVTRHQVKEFINGVAETISKNNSDKSGIPTANGLHCILSQVFEYALDDDLIDRDPTRKAKITKTDYQSKQFEALMEEEQIRLREIIRGEYFEPHVLFLLSTGIRYSELVGLRWSDVDFQRKEILVCRNLITLRFEDEFFVYTDTPKTKASVRVIPLTRNILKILEMVKERCSPCSFTVSGISDFIFTDVDGKLLRNGKLNRILKKYTKNANSNKQDGGSVNLPDFTCHSLRHTYGTNAARIGVPIKITMGLMGHASIETTTGIYQECQPDMLWTGGEMMCSYLERLFSEEGCEEKKSIAEINTMGNASVIETMISTAKHYGASIEQVIRDVKDQYGINNDMAIDIVSGFWSRPTIGATGVYGR